MKIRRCAALLTALMMLLACIPVAIAEDSADLPVIIGAPLTRSTTVQNGMVRVYMASLDNPNSLDVTIHGQYSVDGNMPLYLYEGDVVHIRFNTASGEIYMTVDDVTYAMGREMRLCRCQTSGESYLSIAQARKPSYRYAGDLQLLAQADGSSYKLYPIMHVYLEYYLYGVVPYEMSSSWPVEALKAQAVAARTYTLRAMNGRKSYTYDLVDTSGDQVYNGFTGTVSNAIRAVDETKGIVITNNGSLSGTYYTASNGGQTESVKNAWGNTGYGYLGVKDDPFDAMNPNSNRRRLTIYSDFDHASQNA